jgi:nicotinamide-nucleotide amidase
MKARIITIGDEILIGQIVDTNSAWMAQALGAMGIDVERMVSIADTREAIHEALDEVLQTEVHLVLMTGGLGPTKDDITKQALAEWFESGWRTEASVLERVERYFAMRGIPMPEVNRSQAQVPEKCTVLTNAHGSAPGMWFEKSEKIFVSMPGVPFEMKAIFEHELVPRLDLLRNGQAIVHKTVMTQGQGESTLMEMITEWENELPKQQLKLAYLPSPGAVRLRVSGRGEDPLETRERVERAVQNLLPLIADHVYGFDDESLESAVGKWMIDRKVSVATAESCTGGYVAHLLTSVPGSSAYFKGSVVVYANDVKTGMLGVKAEDIAAHGAVSETVAMQMAIGACTRLASDYAIATTGIAGPDGGSEDKPVGTVWIAIASPHRVFARRFQMGRQRDRNIRMTALQALQLLRKEILHDAKISKLEALL